MKRGTRFEMRTKSAFPMYQLPSDPAELTELLDWLKRFRFYRERCADNHFRFHRNINYWPSTGTIAPDGAPSLPQKGPDALKAYLRKRFPHKFAEIDHENLIGLRQPASPSGASNATSDVVAVAPWEQEVKPIYVDFGTIPGRSESRPAVVFFLDDTDASPVKRKDLKDIEI